MPDQPEQANRQRWSAPAGGSAREASGPIPAGKVIGGDKRRFIIAMRRTAGVTVPVTAPQPAVLDYVAQALKAIPEIEVLDRIGPRGVAQPSADFMGGVPNILVARMTEDNAEMVRHEGRGLLIVERDQPLHLWGWGLAMQRSQVTDAAPAAGPAMAVKIVVVGKDETPIEDAEVHLFGSLTSASDVTDQNGQVSLSLYGETAASVVALGVKPESDYWSFYRVQPAIDTSQPNLVFLRPLLDSFPDLPKQQMLGWGQRAMRLDLLPADYRGQGAKIALIDSGVATTHTDLKSVKFGIDLVNKQIDYNTWTQDVMSHGSLAAGIIAGAETGSGIRGFAPQAELHACKLFPGGLVSQLIEALEYCIEKQIDVACLSLGGIEPSEALEQEILRARRMGVACIVAAGNTAGPVEYPATSPHVLAVAAIGRVGEFPPDSYHAQTVTRVDGSGLFSAKFTCFGPEVAVCAPGVAILSSVPPNNYAVRDGTSLAAAHVTGLAALLSAHHTDFQGPFKARNSDRVDRLFQILKLSAQPLNLGDPARTGFGVPDVLIALGLAPRVSFGGMPSAWQYLPFPANPAALYDFFALSGGTGTLGYSGQAPSMAAR